MNFPVVSLMSSRPFMKYSLYQDAQCMTAQGSHQKLSVSEMIFVVLSYQFLISPNVLVIHGLFQIVDGSQYLDILKVNGKRGNRQELRNLDAL